MSIQQESAPQLKSVLLWQQMQKEAAQILQKEPLLKGYLKKAVLDCSSLGEGLAQIIANRLATPVIGQAELFQICIEAFSADPEIVEKAADDLIAVCSRDPAADGYTTPFLYFKGPHALESWRVAHWLWQQGRRDFARFIQGIVSDVFGVDIHPAAVIGRGIMFDHATGIVIGETARVGDNVSILHNVTLGGTGKEQGDRHPKVGSGVMIGAGAKILGNIKIGDNAKIGAGSVVLNDVHPHTTVAGIPARVVGIPKEAVPSLDMDQDLDTKEAVCTSACGQICNVKII